MSALFDAHNHLHDPRLAPHLDRVSAQMREAGIARCVVNGTSEQDWPRVAELAERHPELVIPSFGLHPWKAAARSPDWRDILTGFLDRFPNACLGECGLDRWIENHDLDDQRHVFLAQLELAAARNLPLSIHCLQAWGALVDCLRDNPRPARGFLLHSYGGSRELVDELAPLGARFSFSGYFLAPRKEPVREAFRAVPGDRVLVETDAPDMLPPAEFRPHRLRDADGTELNHPANLSAIVDGLARVLELPADALQGRLARNFESFFGPDSPEKG